MAITGHNGGPCSTVVKTDVNHRLLGDSALKGMITVLEERPLFC